MLSTIMALSNQMSTLVSNMATMYDHMHQQSMLDSTLQLGNQTVPLIFENATPISRPTIIRPTMFSPSPPTTTGEAPPAVPMPIISSTSRGEKMMIVKYAETTQISTDLVIKHS